MSVRRAFARTRVGIPDESDEGAPCPSLDAILEPRGVLLAISLICGKCLVTQ